MITALDLRVVKPPHALGFQKFVNLCLTKTAVAVSALIQFSQHKIALLIVADAPNEAAARDRVAGEPLCHVIRAAIHRIEGINWKVSGWRLPCKSQRNERERDTQHDWNNPPKRRARHRRAKAAARLRRYDTVDIRS